MFSQLANNGCHGAKAELAFRAPRRFAFTAHAPTPPCPAGSDFRHAPMEFVLDMAPSVQHTVFVMQHSPGFLKVVNEVRPRIREIALEEARRRLAANPKALLIDVREESEWAAGHAVQAIHLGKGILERDIEKTIPDPATECILYCGGGYRSALAAEVAQRMGYTNVFSLMGGFKAMTAAGWPTKT
jgi:rhodanese-related sulfurtransferase